MCLKIILKYLILISLLISFGFLYSKDKIKVKTFEELKTIRKVSLEENDTCVLSQITHIEANSSGTNILVSDKYGFSVALYDSYTGKIIRSFQPTYKYSDSLAIKSKPIYKDSEYLLLSTIADSIEPQYLTQFLNSLNNELSCAVFTSDSTISIICQIKVIRKPKHIPLDFNYLSISIPTAIVNFNLNNEQTSVVPLENLETQFPQNDVLLYDKVNNCYIIYIDYYHKWDNHIYDSLWMLARYTIEGKFINFIYMLPEEYVDTRIGYQINDSPILAYNNQNNLYGVFCISEKIFNIDNTSQNINLKNLGYSNKFILKSLKENHKLAEIYNDSLLYHFPSYINSFTITDKGNLIIKISQVLNEVNNQEKKVQKKNIIQEYDSNGKLIAEMILPYRNEDGAFSSIFYSIPDKALVFFQISQEKGWTVTYKKWYEK